MCGCGFALIVNAILEPKKSQMGQIEQFRDALEKNDEFGGKSAWHYSIVIRSSRSSKVLLNCAVAKVRVHQIHMSCFAGKFCA